MKFCDRHLEALRQAIVARGIGDFIASDAEESALKLASQCELGDVNQLNYEPLIIAQRSIVNNVIRNVGANEAFAGLDDAKIDCPVCIANTLHAQVCNHKDCGMSPLDGCDIWIEYAADGVAELAAEIGAIASA